MVYYTITFQDVILLLVITRKRQAGMETSSPGMLLAIGISIRCFLLWILRCTFLEDMVISCTRMTYKNIVSIQASGHRLNIRVISLHHVIWQDWAQRPKEIPPTF